MRTKLILGIAVLCIVGAAFLAGMWVGHSFIPPFSTALNSPDLLEPVQGAVLKRDGQQAFSWSKVPQAEKYHIYIAHSGNMDRPIVDQEMEVNVFQMSPQWFSVSTGWTWKVKAQVDGEWSKWSEVRSFDVEPDGK